MMADDGECAPRKFKGSEDPGKLKLSRLQNVGKEIAEQTFSSGSD